MVYTKEKEVFLVSKKALNFLIEPVELYKKVETNISKCNSCPFKNSEDEFAKRYCREFCKDCTNKIVTVPKFTKYKISEKKLSNKTKVKVSKKALTSFKLNRLTSRKIQYITALQSKLMLAYFKLANNKGIINLLSKKTLANYVRCSIKSIDNCNSVLAMFGLIEYQVNSQNEITIVIKDFHEQHMKNGSGYVVIASSLYDELLKITNLHEMRVALKAILLFDANKRFGNKTILTLDKLKDILPEYKQKKYKLKNFVNSILNIFRNGLEAKTVPGIGIEFIINDEFNGKAIRKILASEHSAFFEKYLSEKFVYIPTLSKKVDNLSKLSLEYGLNKIKEAVEQCDYSIVLKSTTEFGAYIRYYVEKSLEIKESFFEIA